MPASKPALAEWLSKADAASFLGVSSRQIERREAQGYLQKRLAPRRMGESTSRSEYSRADCEALKAGTPNTHAREVAAPGETDQDASIRLKPDHANGAGKALTLAQQQRGERWQGTGVFADALAVLLAKTQAHPAPKPWLTLAEAVDYSGLPAPYLVQAARAGLFRAINVGKGAREFWRFNREGLSK